MGLASIATKKRKMLSTVEDTHPCTAPAFVRTVIPQTQHKTCVSSGTERTHRPGAIFRSTHLALYLEEIREELRPTFRPTSLFSSWLETSIQLQSSEGQTDQTSTSRLRYRLFGMGRERWVFSLVWREFQKKNAGSGARQAQHYRQGGVGETRKCECFKICYR